MATIPIVIHVISIAMADSCTARDKPAGIIAIAAKASSPAPIPTPIPSIMTIDEHAAFPTLISSTPIPLSIAGVVPVDEYIRLPSQPDSSSTALA